MSEERQREKALDGIQKSVNSKFSFLSVRRSIFQVQSFVLNVNHFVHLVCLKNVESVGIKFAAEFKSLPLL